MGAADIPPPTGSPYPEGAEPYEGQPADGTEIEAVEVQHADGPGGARGVAPFVAAVGAGVVATMVYNGGSWVIKEAWQAGTREPVPTPRPPVLYDKGSGMTYSRQPNGTYLQTGVASQI